MDFLKKNYKILLSVLGFMIALYVLPNFVDLNSQKSYIENKIEETFGFKVSINGKISFTILPRPSLILNRVQISSKDKDSKAGIFLNASKIFVNTGISNLFEKNITANKIGVMDATFYANAYKTSGYENLDNLLNGKTFKQISVRNSRVVLGNDFINKINLTFKTTNDGKVVGTGSLGFKEGKIEDLTAKLSYLNKENYNVVTDFIYGFGRNKIKNNLTYIMKDNERTYSGKIDISTDNLSKLFNTFNKEFSLPKTPMFSDKLNIRASFQNSLDAILINDGSFEGNSVVASFKGKVPFLKNENFKIDTKNISLNIDFSNLVLDRIFHVKRDIAQNPLSTLLDSRDLLKLFKYATLNISAKSIILNNAVMNNLKLSTSPIFYDNKFNGIDVNNLNYQIKNNYLNLSGKILNVLDDMTLNFNVDTNIPFFITNVFDTRLKVTKFKSDFSMSPKFLKLDNLNMNIGNNNIFGNFSYTKDNEKYSYIANLKSDFIDLDNIFKSKIDLQFIILKLSEIGKGSLNITSAFKKFKMNSNNYEALKLNSNFSDGTLHIKNLTFKDNDYSSQMKGDLVDITGNNGSFKDFEYKISSSTLKGLTLPFIRNTFVEKMIANGVNQINILLNGDAKNPVSDVDASLNNIRVRVNGRLLDSNSEYKIELSHNELKGFLFSWGYIDENLMNYFYDNIPFTVRADIKGDNISNINIELKKNKITGSITREKVKKETITSVVLNSDKLDIKGIIKRIRDTDGYVDLMLKMIRLLPYNLSISAPKLEDYDGNSYQDFSLDIKNSDNPGSLKFALKKGNYSINLNSEILNSNVFEGNIDISNFSIPDKLMNNELLNLVSGSLSSKIKFKTFGTTAYQLLSNLSGDFDVDILNGTIRGISDYQTILYNIINLSNITTNNVIYSLEASLKSGSIDFSNLNIKGKLSEANVENAAFKLSAPNIDISGFLGGNLIQKSLNIESVFDIANLSPNNLVIMYNLKGYINNLSGKVDTSTLISKINTVYLQKKKKDINLQ
ncbi:MAG: hypothetical protein J6J27_00800 [Alphaproteobacteria bacterium]|nr:hypothetical protein [Alphaproteobacteria bacterium]